MVTPSRKLLPYGLKRVGALTMMVCLMNCQNVDNSGSSIYVCLNGQDDYPRFVEIFREIGQRRGLEFFDRSTESASEVRATSLGNSGYPDTPINISVVGASNVEAIAGNLGLTDHKIGIGFSPGEASEALKMVLIDRFREEYEVGIPQDGQRITVKDICGASAKSTVGK